MKNYWKDKEGKLTFSQICTNDGPIFENDLNKNASKEYMEAFLTFQKNHLLKYITERNVEDALFEKPSLKTVRKQ